MTLHLRDVSRGSFVSEYVFDHHAKPTDHCGACVPDGGTTRRYFNTRHARADSPTWTWLVTALLFIAIMWLSTAPMYKPLEETEAQPLTPFEQRYAAADGFEEAHDIALDRRSMCRAREPVWEDIL